MRARGFVRTCWKTKNWDPNKDPTQDSSSTDSEDEREELEMENRDKIDTAMKTNSNEMSPNHNMSFKSSEGRDIMDDSVQNYDMMATPNQRTRRMSDAKTRRRLMMKQPEIINIEDV